MNQTEVWGPDARSFNGNLFVNNNATLFLEGTRVRLNGSLTVLPGGLLVARAKDGKPTELLPRSPQAVLEVLVLGRFRAEGERALNVTALSGRDYGSAFTWGGFYVRGEAHLEGTIIEGGTAGVLVDHAGNLTMRNSRVVGNGPVGLAIQGRADLQHVAIEAQAVGISASMSHHILVQDSLIASQETNIHCHNAVVRVERTLLLGGASSSITCEGSSRLAAENVTARGYGQWGFLVHNVEGARPTFLGKNLTLDGMNRADQGAYFLGGHWAYLADTRIINNLGGGIMSVNTDLTLRNASIVKNGGKAVHVVEAPFAETGSDFGFRDAADRNGQGVEVWGAPRVIVEDEKGRLLRGALVEIRHDGNGTVVAHQRSGMQERAVLDFPLWMTDAAGRVLREPPYTLSVKGDGYETFEEPLTTYFGPVTVTLSKDVGQQLERAAVASIALIVLATPIAFSVTAFFRRRRAGGT